MCAAYWWTKSSCRWLSMAFTQRRWRTCSAVQCGGRMEWDDARAGTHAVLTDPGRGGWGGEPTDICIVFSLQGVGHAGRPQLSLRLRKGGARGVHASMHACSTASASAPHTSARPATQGPPHQLDSVFCAGRLAQRQQHARRDRARPPDTSPATRRMHAHSQPSLSLLCMAGTAATASTSCGMHVVVVLTSAD